MTIFVSRNITVFAATCPSRARKTRAQNVRYCLLRGIARVFPLFLSVLSHRRYARKLFASTIHPPTLSTRLEPGSRTEEEEAARNHPGFSEEKKRRSIVPSLQCPTALINASDRADKSAVVAIVLSRHFVFIARCPPFFGRFRSTRRSVTNSMSRRGVESTIWIHWHGDRIEIYVRDNAIANRKMIVRWNNWWSKYLSI